METVILIYHTDKWQSWSSHRVIGIATDIEEALKLARQDKDAMADVISNDGQITMFEFEVNKKDSESQIFYTGNDKNLEMLLKTKKLIKQAYKSRGY
jgi:hypothetical protein